MFQCRCEYKELISKGRCDDGFTWSLSIYECQCDKTCDVGEHLDYANCKCRKRLIKWLKMKWDINGNEMIHNGTSIILMDIDSVYIYIGIR